MEDGVMSNFTVKDLYPEDRAVMAALVAAAKEAGPDHADASIRGCLAEMNRLARGYYWTGRHWLRFPRTA
jgi:hypothetical protein